METICLLIVDQHPVVEEGLEFLLQDYPDICIAATAGNGVEGLEEVRQKAIDIAVIDPALPELDGADAIQLYRQEKPGLGIIVYTDQSDEASVFRALKAGAKGYILKSSPIAELVDAIRQVQTGSYILSPSLSPTIIEFYLEHRGSEVDQLGEYQDLTEREKQVFRLLASGKQTREIADLLCISPKTVAKHRVAVKKKLSAQTLAELIQIAIRLGIVNIEGG